MKNKILASFYNPMEKDLPVFFRQTVEGKGVLQNIKFTSKLQNFLLVNSSIMSFYLIPIFFLVAINKIEFFKKDLKFFIYSFFLLIMGQILLNQCQ